MSKGYTGTQHVKVDGDQWLTPLKNLHAALSMNGFRADISRNGLAFNVLSKPILCVPITPFSFTEDMDYMKERYPDWYALNKNLEGYYQDFYRDGEDRVLMLIVDVEQVFTPSGLRTMAECLAPLLGASFLPKQKSIYISKSDTNNEPLAAIISSSIDKLEERLLTS